MTGKRESDENEDFIEDAEIVAPEGETPYDESSDDSQADEISQEEREVEPEEPAAETYEAEDEATDVDPVKEEFIEPEDATITAAEDNAELEDPHPEPKEVATPPAPTLTTVIEKRGGFSALLGGIAAAVVGFLVAQFVPEGWPVTPDTATTDALQVADGEIRDVLATKVDSDALAPLSEQLTEIAARIEGLTQAAAAQSEDIAALTNRVAALEDRPIVDLSSLDNSEAVEAELQALRDEIAAVSAEAQRQIEAARSEATILEQNAADAADAAARRAALSRVLAALESGVPFEAMLSEFAELTDADVPGALVAAAADGVPTLASLQESYPEAAREALAAMRSENAGGENTLGNFFRNQFGVRSLEPQDGDSPNAILSRIEGAITDGRLQDAIAEVATLPASGAEVLAPWTDKVQLRIDAIAAADALTEQQISN